MLAHLTGEKRLLARNLFSTVTLLLLSLYFFLLIFLFPEFGKILGNIAILAALGAAATVALGLPAERPLWPYYVYIGGLVGYAGSVLLSVRLAPSIPGYGLTDAHFLDLPGVAIALAVGLGLRGQRAVERLLVAVLVIAGVYYLGETMNLFEDSSYREGMLVLSRRYHTILAMELVLLFSLFLAFAALTKNRRHALVTMLLAILIGFLLLLTKTRSGFFAAAFVTIPAVALVRRGTGTWRQTIVVVCVLMFLAAPAASLLWFLGAGPERRAPTNMFGRFMAWKIALQIASEEPFYRKMVGNGRLYRTFPAVAKHYDIDLNDLGRGELKHAHNVLLQTFVETGMLGTMTLVMAWLTALYRALSAWIRSRREDKVVPGVMVVAMLTMAITAQMDCLLTGIRGQLCWFIIGMAFASGRGVLSPVPTDSTGGAQDEPIDC